MENYEMNEYLSRFYEPKVTAYEFLKCFFAYLKLSDIQEVQRDLVTFIYKQKQIEEYSDVLDEINFKSNGISYYSDDVDDALFNLQNGGLLGKMNPSFGILIVKYTNEEVQETIKAIPTEYSVIIKGIAENYKKQSV